MPFYISRKEYLKVLSFESELIYRVSESFTWKKFLRLSSALSLKGLYFAKSAHVVFILQRFGLERAGHYFDSLLQTRKKICKIDSLHFCDEWCQISWYYFNNQNNWFNYLWYFSVFTPIFLFLTRQVVRLLVLRN